jgi:hypothetical protein
VNRSRLAALSAGAIFLVASVLVPATAFAAGTGTISLSPTPVSTTTGSTFTVTINTQAAVAMSGASASINFNKSMLQVISVSTPAAGSGWNVPGATGTTYVAPTVGDIATANSTGHLAATSAYFTDGASSLPANTNEVLATVTFFAIATGSSNITLGTANPDVSSIIDGTPASYGTVVAITTSDSAVGITAGGPGSVVGTGTTNSTSINTTITGSVAAPTLALTCLPNPVTVPLVRNANNQAPLNCTVGSNGAWTLSVVDPSPAGPTHGKMTDAVQIPTAVLANPLHTVSAQADVDMSASTTAAQLFTSANSVNVGLTLTQIVNPGDKPGSYGMSLVFSVLNTF